MFEAGLVSVAGQEPGAVWDSLLSLLSLLSAFI